LRGRDAGAVAGALGVFAFRVMSALGQKQTFELALPMSALPPKADIRITGVTQSLPLIHAAICEL
jgi:hypothetical protein